MKNKTIYYLFGLDLVCLYNNKDIDTVISELKKDPGLGIIYKFNPKTEHINILLNDFSSWGEFVEIGKTIYDKIDKEIYSFSLKF